MSILGLNSELSVSRTNLFFFESESNSGDVSSRFFPCEAGVIGKHKVTYFEGYLLQTTPNFQNSLMPHY